MTVTLGGRDGNTVLGMSGGWRRTFALPSDAAIVLSFRYRLTQSAGYASDEISEVLVRVDGAQPGTGGTDDVARLVGNGNGGSPITTGWRLFVVDLGTLAAGTHTLTIGGYNNKKTSSDEFTDVVIDDIEMTAAAPPPPPPPASLLEAPFDAGADGFACLDDVFRGTSASAYASGAWSATAGFGGAGLKITLGGIDNTVVPGMSGGWRRTFSLSAAAPAVLSFRYTLTQGANYESDELSEMLVRVDGVQPGTGGTDYVARLVGDGNGGSPRTTGWQLFEVNLGTLGAGTHTLTIGGYNNKKTLNDEITEVLIDDVHVR